jgi:hypothetical protein
MRVALPLLSFVALNLVACSGGGLVGSRDPDAGGSEPDATPIPVDGGSKVDAASSDASSAPDAAPTTDATPPPDTSTPPDAAPPADASDGATPTEFDLYVTMTGFDAEDGQDFHAYAMDTTTGDSWASCGGGGAIEMGEVAQYLDTNTLIEGHTYAYEYWFDTSSFTFCSSGPYVPTYYMHTFGPVTGTTYITVTPSDPLND